MSRKFLAAALWAIVVALAVHLLEFPGSVPDFEKKSGGGTLLDVKPSFSEDAAYARLEKYGERGRANYRFRNLTVDVLLPLSVLPFLYLFMQRATGRLRLRRAGRVFLLSLPFAYVVFDLAENSTVIALLASYPDRSSFLAALLPFLTVIKRGASMLALAVPVVIFVVVRFRGKARVIAPND